MANRTVAPDRAQAKNSAWSLASPDGRVTITVSQHPDGRLTWRVTRDSSQVIADSPLGIRRHDQVFGDSLTLLEARKPTTIDERYRMPHGKRLDHVVCGRERVLVFANPEGAKLELVLRAHDDGVAFRYRFPETDPTPRRVLDELTGFAVPNGAKGWMLPYGPVGEIGPAYEDFFQEVTAGTAAPSPLGWSFPALFRTPLGMWLLVTEAAVDGNYAGTHLAADAQGGVYRIRFPDPAEGRNVGEAQPLSPLPWIMPWRVVIIGDTALRILESDLVLDLSPPSRVKDVSWVVPGRASWSWWSDSDSPKHAEVLNRFIDLAAEMGWEYSLVDANWHEMQSGNIQDVVAHAKARGVGLLIWYNSGGPHNDREAGPRDLMHVRDVRRAEFARIKKWGVKGIKVDFWISDKPDRIRQYRELLEDAADFQLLVNLHGSTIPRGWSREFPHLVTMEAVLGAEQYKFLEAFPTRVAWHNTVLPFTRNVIGPMDYTPVTFSDAKYARTTTNAHELALAVVFESGIQHFADRVDIYRALPDAPKRFLRDVPAAWDETHCLAGEPGRFVLVARRHGDTWYVGGLNGLDDEQAVCVDLGFLGTGSWDMLLIRDGAAARTFQSETRRVAPLTTIEVPMRGRGGFVMKLDR